MSDENYFVLQLNHLTPEAREEYLQCVQDAEAHKPEALIAVLGFQQPVVTEITAQFWKCHCPTEFLHPLLWRRCPICGVTQGPFAEVKDVKEENLFDHVAYYERILSHVQQDAPTR